MFFFFFKQKTAYEMRISDWSSDVCSSDLRGHAEAGHADLPEVKQPGAEQARHQQAEGARSAALGGGVRQQAERPPQQEAEGDDEEPEAGRLEAQQVAQNGRASWRERVGRYV